MTVSSIPNTPAPEETTKQLLDAVKSARPDIMVESTVASTRSQVLFFENISSRELISIARTDSVLGRGNVYTPIKNIESLARRYGPKALIPIQGGSNTYFSNFSIKLEQKVPDTGTGPFGQIVYIDEESGDLVIDVIDLKDDEQVEVQIMKRSTVLDDTIYSGGQF